MWVADRGDDLIYGYDTASKTLVRTIATLQAAGNHDAEGIWSDGTTMWVADQDLAWIYAYHMPAASIQTPSPLGNPTQLTAAAGSRSGEVSLRWTPAANATVHRVYLRKTDGTGGRDWPDALSGDANEATLTGLEVGQTYQFRVRAGQEQSDGTTQWSEWSNWVRGTPTSGTVLTEAQLSISSGSAQTCGLRADGSAVCWGWNEYGQATPPAGATFAAISSGYIHTCGLLADGSAVCWGLNSFGRATPPAGATFAAISSGGAHTCGLRADGSAVCWGYNNHGQLTAPAELTQTPSPLGNPTGLTATAASQSGEVSLRWTPAANASGYIIIAINVNDISGDVVAIPLNDGGLETSLVSGLTPGATYDVYVAATGTGGKFTLSEPARVTLP